MNLTAKNAKNAKMKFCRGNFPFFASFVLFVVK